MPRGLKPFLISWAGCAGTEVPAYLRDEGNGRGKGEDDKQVLPLRQAQGQDDNFYEMCGAKPMSQMRDMGHPKTVVRFRERYPTLPLRVEDGAPGVVAA
jgi:hypothetical protein